MAYRFPNVTDYVITKIQLQVFGTGVIRWLNDVDTSFFDLTCTAETGLVTIDGIELDGGMFRELFAFVVSGTPTILAIITGYRPPTTNP